MQYQDHYDTPTLKTYCNTLNQRAKSLQAEGKITPEQLLDCILGSAGACQWCGVSVVGAEFEIDHIYSLSSGGRNTSDNIVLACPDCNRRKGEKHPARFAAEVVARSGNKTPLITRLFSRYDDGVFVQRQMFDDDPNRSVSRSDEDRNDDDSSVVPPYTW